MAIEGTLSTIFRGVGLDRYDIMARLRPAVLAIMPVILVALLDVPEARTLEGLFASLVSICGLTYLMGQVAGRRGRVLESRLGKRAGRLHSARLLTFEDPTIPVDTKLRYHAFLQAKGVAMASPEEERQDPTRAFERSRSAVDWLLVFTRPAAKTSLLFDKNVAYGFNRNLCGLKGIAIGIDIVAMAVDAALIAMAWADHGARTNGLILEGVLAVTLLLWIFVVNETAVTDASLAYARQLFSHCEKVA